MFNDTYDHIREIERLMRQIPNFRPRGWLSISPYTGLVKCFHINCPHKRFERVWREFRQLDISVYPIDKLLKVSVRCVVLSFGHLVSSYVFVFT